MCLLHQMKSRFIHTNFVCITPDIQLYKQFYTMRSHFVMSSSKSASLCDSWCKTILTKKKKKKEILISAAARKLVIWNCYIKTHYLKVDLFSLQEITSASCQLHICLVLYFILIFSSQPFIPAFPFHFSPASHPPFSVPSF